MYSFKTTGTCSRQINYDIENGTVKNVRFVGGCTGNTTGISKLVEGMKIEDVIERLEGIQCRANTSCPDQLAHALKQHLKQ